ncbi:MAG: 2-dehydro-3-deoxygalactonokinase [Blastocatellia bacterium]
MNNAIFVDAGTTNTRVWLMHGEEIRAHASTMVGVRDSARDGSTTRLQAALRDLLLEVQAQESASCVVAAGMITSALGLAEVPHLPAPAGLPELAAATQTWQFPAVTPLPVLLVPGVRSGAAECDFNSVANVDVMRGEETLCAGLMELGLAEPPCTVLNLGSHWKAIQLDAARRIAASVTSLTGELIYTTQTQTILASAVPHERPATIAPEWAAAGMREQRQSGLARALFCVRLLEQKGHCTPNERLAYLIGAYIAEDFDGLQKHGLLPAGQSVLLTSGGVIAETWAQLLTENAMQARIVRQEESEQAVLTGLRAVLQQCAPRLLSAS